jgi:S1-C subfamily serine protease
VDDIKVKDLDDIRANLATKYVGNIVKVQVQRDETEFELMVELGAPGR